MDGREVQVLIYYHASSRMCNKILFKKKRRNGIKLRSKETIIPYFTSSQSALASPTLN